jgi:hypothetical protein
VYSQMYNLILVVGKEQRNHARDAGFVHFHQQFWLVEVDREAYYSHLKGQDVGLVRFSDH